MSQKQALNDMLTELDYPQQTVESLDEDKEFIEWLSGKSLEDFEEEEGLVDEVVEPVPMG